MRYITQKECLVLTEKQDLSANEQHCMGILVKKLQNALENKYGVPASLERGSRVVSIADNYYHLNYQSNEVTLGERYTKYINENLMLRTQMSSTIPQLLRTYKQDGDKLYLCPGIVYRRDVRDKTHVGEPHQMDVWYLTKNIQDRKSLLELVSTIVGVIEVLLKKKIEWRYTETNHNYTDDGIEVEIKHNGNWMEILECGLIGKSILKKHNLENYSGLALGLGLERLVMIVKDIDDIRILYDKRELIQNQMYDLKKYKEVSRQPSIQRDLSIAIDENINEEEITEMITMGLHSETLEVIETIKLLNETTYSEMPAIGIERLGMRVGQKNVLLRVVLRDLLVSIEREKANSIYNEIYALIHKGELGYMIKP